MVWFRLSRLVIAGTFAALWSSAQTPPPVSSSARAFALSLVSPPSAYIGIGFQEIDAERAKALKLPEERGIEVTIVKQGSPAEKAGLVKGDVILEYNGQRVEGSNSFLRFVKETPPGRVVKLGIVRNGQTLVIAVATVSRKEAGESESWRVEIPEILEIPRFRIPDFPEPTMSWNSLALGVRAESVSGEFAEFFGAKEGVLIRSVQKDSPAERAGLKVGDLIIACDSAPVSSLRQLSKRFEVANKRTVTLTVLRNRSEMQIPVALEPVRPLLPRGREVKF